MPVLERGVRTPPGTLVFVPVDGRRMAPRPPFLDPYILDKIQAQVVRRAMEPRTAEWVLVPCLISLRAEFNIAGPRRDKSSDGSIGDTAHAQSSSDHNPDETGATPYEDSDRINEVHAIDVDDSGPWLDGFDFDDAIERIRLRHQRGEDDRLQNIIRNRRITSRSWGWTWREYTGSSPHTEHAHFSARYTTAQEDDTSPWMQEDDDMPLSDADAAKVAKYVWAFDPGNNTTGETNGGVKNPDYDPKAGVPNATVQPVWSLYRTLVIDKVVYQNRDRLDQALAALAKILANVTADDGEAQQLIAAIQRAQQDTVAGVGELLGAGQQSPPAVAALLRDLFGPAMAAQIGEELRSDAVR